jgi:hypothetical protein
MKCESSDTKDITWQYSFVNSWCDIHAISHRKSIEPLLLTVSGLPVYPISHPVAETLAFFACAIDSARLVTADMFNLCIQKLLKSRVIEMAS